MVKAKIRIIAILFVLGFSDLFAQYTYINPGIKLGYMFGENGGFVYGFEISVTHYDEKSGPIWGCVLDWDVTKELNKVHFGVEGSALFMGLDIGPTYAWRDDKHYYGFSIIPFAGAFLIPYYNYTYLGPNNSTHEIGSYIKLTIPIQRRAGNWN
jgi:hypothetical protein